MRTPNIGPQTFARLIERFGNATDALAALQDIASRVAKGRRIELPSPASIEDEIAATGQIGARNASGRGERSRAVWWWSKRRSSRAS